MQRVDFDELVRVFALDQLDLLFRLSCLLLQILELLDVLLVVLGFRLRRLPHLRNKIELGIQDDQERLDDYVLLRVIEIGADVAADHFLGQLKRFLHFSAALCEIGDEVLEHEADVARAGDPAARVCHFSELQSELVTQAARILGHEHLLDQDE